VYAEIKKRTKDALLRLIEREREGELVDRALIKNILGIFIEVGLMGVGGMRGNMWDVLVDAVLMHAQVLEAANSMSRNKVN
jgi:hypothetical protein